MYLLFTTKTCPECPQAKALIEQKGLEVEYVDASSSEGLSIARKHRVLKVPTVLNVEGDEVLKSFVGFSEIAAFL